MLYRGRELTIAVVIVAGLIGIIAAGVFAADVEDSTPSPEPFDSVTTLGISQEDQRDAEHDDLSIPRVQVFYSQYEYVVGYYGVEQAVSTLDQPEHDQQFGYPLVVYVSDYGGTTVELTDEGYLTAETSTGWVDASDAYFVVDSEARTPAGETVVPFGSESAATVFVDEHGGEIVDWPELRTRSFDVDSAAVVRDRVDEQRSQADEQVDAVEPLLDRDPVRTVEDDETVQDAIDDAPAGSTVEIPAGTYEETLRIDEPLTLRGEDATIRGDGEGNGIEVRADDVAIDGVHVDGVGNQTRDPDAATEDGDEEDWDANIESGYGHGDAGIHVVDATGVYVTNVSIETPANGVLLRDAPDAVVDDSTVDGSEEWRDGFMGVMSMRSPGVVQNSTFDGGRDGVYLHRSPETVIRDNEFYDNRFGVHLMHTSDSVIADNHARGQELAGLTIMTNPTHNAIVGNDVREATHGILPAGSQSYVADNVVADNEYGITTSADQSLYEANVIYDNDVGLRTGSILASNRVVHNDIVANDQHVDANIGPLRIWTFDGQGNYWDGAYGTESGGVLDRSYSPTDPVQGQLHRTDGALTLAESPAARGLSELRGTTPGLRSGSVVDTAPLAEPVNPDRLAELDDEQRSELGEDGGDTS
ncbi:right-handed parallel beta-helix repeat-containing protein [Natranaeroarchaeum aerophilus]|uniref:Right-handed parallel beta-helix repeat-containing protein n=1 Tax=Natranaeroarchaeum aerophilus TaxID=2917711 RepID=A0AAE3FQ22_9EURY|nr:right-handed parallel beta-helix repeat-containing protein [Natranaeroarchaeum aerophilus]MCL9813066.1 right-handed parallel beta-helix repeat-containing protein [Natranaeroarchaeum aerophilus]